MLTSTHFCNCHQFASVYMLCSCRYILRLLAALGTLLIITEQYMEPTIANSIVPLRELNVAHILERMLKLSIPTLYGWIIIFYALFHVWLNILAEVTYFGDREFYKVRSLPSFPPKQIPFYVKAVKDLFIRQKGKGSLFFLQLELQNLSNLHLRLTTLPSITKKGRRLEPSQAFATVSNFKSLQSWS